MHKPWKVKPETIEDFRHMAFKVLDYEKCWKQGLNDIPQLREAMANGLIGIHKMGFEYALNRLKEFEL